MPPDTFSHIGSSPRPSDEPLTRVLLASQKIPYKCQRHQQFDKQTLVFPKGLTPLLYKHAPCHIDRVYKNSRDEHFFELHWLDCRRRPVMVKSEVAKRMCPELVFRFYSWLKHEKQLYLNRDGQYEVFWYEQAATDWEMEDDAYVVEETEDTPRMPLWKMKFTKVTHMMGMKDWIKLLEKGRRVT